MARLISALPFMTNPQYTNTKVNYIIITAAGSGQRMGASLPKQFLLVAGKPVLMRTIERFVAAGESLNIILTLPHEQQEYWQRLCEEHRFSVPLTVVDGGKTRFHSVRNGLMAIPEGANGVVGVHDGVRPFVSIDVIKRCYDAARRAGSAAPVVPIADSLRLMAGEKWAHNVPRNAYRAVQTPQVFDISTLKAAFSQPFADSFTDEVSVVESLGKAVNTVEGNRENIKLTTPIDLKLAEILANEGF